MVKMPKVGSVVAEKYVLERQLGEGGFGIVFEARHEQMDRQVAIKFLHSAYAATDEMEGRFWQEAKLLSALNHRNLPIFFDYGIWQEQQPFFAMELVNGVNLSDFVASGKGTIGNTVSIMREVASALLYCHSNGIVHRDLKPENIILVSGTSESTVKLIDLGLAKILPEAVVPRQHLTEAGHLVGSVLYMSPEQCLGHEVDASTDIYAFGCILFYCLSGQPLFSGGSFYEIMAKHVSESPPDLHYPDSPLMSRLQSVITRCTEKQAVDRYRSMQDVSDELVSIYSEFLAVDGVSLNIPVVERGDGAHITEFILPPGKSTLSAAQLILASIVMIVVVAIVLIPLTSNFVKYLPLSHTIRKDSGTATGKSSRQLFAEARDIADPDYRLIRHHLDLLQQSLASNERDHLLSDSTVLVARLDIVDLSMHLADFSDDPGAEVARTRSFDEAIKLIELPVFAAQPDWFRIKTYEFASRMGMHYANTNASGRDRAKRAQSILIPMIRSELSRFEKFKRSQFEQTRFIECLAILDPSVSNLDKLGAELEKYFMGDAHTAVAFCSVARAYYSDAGPADVVIQRILNLCSLSQKSMKIGGSESAFAVNKLAYLYADVGKSQQAIDFTRRCMALDADFDPVGMLGIEAQSLEKLGKRAEALECIEKMYNTKRPEVRNFLEGFVTAARTAGYPEDAETVERKYLRALPRVNKTPAGCSNAFRRDVEAVWCTATTS